MNRKRYRQISATVLVMGLVAAACGGDDDTTEPTDAPTVTTAPDGGDGDGMSLAGVCPDVIGIQTDWFPEAEHGALYHLIGDDYTIDTDKKTVTGSMVVNGQDYGVDVEIRAGGPAIASPSVAAEMYLDDSLTLGYATTDSQILRYTEAPLLSVMAPLEQNPQIIYWDPETYPNIKTLADLGTEGVTVNVFGGGTFSDVFVAQGIWQAGQVDPSYDATPGRFIAEGDIAQQGFATAEPWLYKNEFEDYGRDLAFQSLNDAGFPVYSQTLGIRPDDLETLRPCLEQLIPIIQTATVDYYADPADTNALIVETVKAYDTFWTYPAELAEFSAATQIELGYAGNGPDDTVGNMDESRVQEVLDAMAAASMDFPADLTPGDLVTNEFIDMSIGFGASSATPDTLPEGTSPEASGGGELEGMKGTTPKGADVSAWIPAVNEFWVAKGNDELTDFNYAAESYDAVVVMALAVAQAGTDGSAFAAEIVDITGAPGEKCTAFAECLALIDAGTGIDYDGISGPHDFNGNGEPLKGSYAVLEFGADNRLDDSLEYLVTAESPESEIVDLVPVTVERAGDGVFKIGSLLPGTGNLAFLGPPEFAGVEYAIDEINAAGGVLGQPIEYSAGDSGDTSTDIASVTSDRLISEGVDAIIGAASSGVTLTVIEKITSAGVTMFSPANTSPALSTYDDKGLYFRNAPPDGLQGAIVANLILEDGNASVYIMNLDDSYGNGIAAVINNVLTANGVEVLGVKAYDPAAATFDAEVAEIVGADPDAVVLIAFQEGSRILRTMVEQGVGPTTRNFYGTDGNMGNATGEDFDAGN